MKSILSCLAYTVAAAVLAIHSAAGAEADDYYLFKISGADNCVAVDDNNTVAVLLATCNGDASQLWTFGAKNNTWKNVMTGTCLTLNSITFDNAAENKVMLQECGGEATEFQSFESAPGALVSQSRKECVAPCIEGETSICSFSEENNSGWCSASAKPAINTKLSSVSYCSLEAAWGYWQLVDETECNKTCGRGTKNVTYECTPMVDGFLSACCNTPRPAVSVSCNTIPCDDKIEDYLLLKTVDTSQCLQADEKSENVTLAYCTGEDGQLWKNVDGKDLVNKLTMKCLTVPSYFSTTSPNLPFTSNCVARQGSQQFDLPLLNSKAHHVCIGRTASKVLTAARDSDAESHQWCSAGGIDGKPATNDEIVAVKMCDSDEFAEKCATENTVLTEAARKPAMTTADSAATKAATAAMNGADMIYATSAEESVSKIDTSDSNDTSSEGPASTSSEAAPASTTAEDITTTSLSVYTSGIILPDDFVLYLVPNQ